MEAAFSSTLEAVEVETPSEEWVVVDSPVGSRGVGGIRLGVGGSASRKGSDQPLACGLEMAIGSESLLANGSPVQSAYAAEKKKRKQFSYSHRAKDGRREGPFFAHTKFGERGGICIDET